MGTELQMEAVGRWYGGQDIRLGRERQKRLVYGHWVDRGELLIVSRGYLGLWRDVQGGEAD